MMLRVIYRWEKTSRANQVNANKLFKIRERQGILMKGKRGEIILNEEALSDIKNIIERYGGRVLEIKKYVTTNETADHLNIKETLREYLKNENYNVKDEYKIEIGMQKNNKPKVCSFDMLADDGKKRLGLEILVKTTDISFFEEKRKAVDELWLAIPSNFPSYRLLKILSKYKDKIDNVVLVNPQAKRILGQVSIPGLIEVSEEKKIIGKLFNLIEHVREGRAQPKQLADFAAKTIAERSLEKMSDELAELLHDAIDFEDNPSIILLNDMENTAKQIERRLP